MIFCVNKINFYNLLFYYSEGKMFKIYDINERIFWIAMIYN